MRRFTLALATLIATVATAQPDRTLTQVSTIDALLAGVYDGATTYEALLEHGDFGIGTFNALDGEAIILEGEVYQVRSDGNVYRPDPETTMTPFASVAPFTAPQSTAINRAMDLEDFEALLESAEPNANVFCAIKVTGRFSHIRTRSVPAQSKPYRPLVEVTREQPEFELHDVRGTLVGFRSPAFVQGINVPGLHLHFLSEDRQRGGHVLAFTLDSGTLETARYARFLMLLPEDDAFHAIDFNIDRSQELHEAEK